jgi:hypothetical protein
VNCSAGTIHRVLQRLLRERISIRDLLTVLETLADHASLTKNIDILTGYVPGPGPDHHEAVPTGYGNITVLSPEIEERSPLRSARFESYLTVDPNWQKRSSAASRVSEPSPRGACSPSCRAPRVPGFISEGPGEVFFRISSCSPTTRSRTM